MSMQSHPPIPVLWDYGIHPEVGFVAPNPPDLPDYYAPWCKIILDLPQMLKAGVLRHEIDSLEILNTERLTSLAQWQRAYVILGYLTQGYIWQDKAQPAAVVPASIGEPFIQVCKHLGMEPVLSYAGLCLWNWIPNTDQETSNHLKLLSNFNSIKSYALFTGTRDEDAFNLVPVMVEAEGGKLLKMLLDIVSADLRGDFVDMEATLLTCAATLNKMGEILSVLHQNCDPGIFYHEVRPMIAGSKGSEDKGLPDGVVFQRSDGSRTAVRCVGGSAGQSGYFQFLDYMFGVEHESTLLIEMRSYMPKYHREFLVAVESLPSVRDILSRNSNDSRLGDAFQVAVEAFKQWRTKHVVIVSRYIVQPASIEMNGAREKRKLVIEQKGTAGSLPVPFLKQYRDETVVKFEN